MIITLIAVLHIHSDVFNHVLYSSKNLLVLPKSLNITLNIINLIHCIYLYIVLLEILNCI